jgi:Na+/H+ antiporter NhaD/arsenite permease-like protein
MYIAIIVVFILGYLLIATEHTVKIDKAATALFTGVTLWTMLAIGHFSGEMAIDETVLHDLSGIAAILFFLLAAMAIVELVDTYHGFSIITDRLNSKNKLKLLWILSIITFFLSAILDNMTTAIVMSSLLRKILKDKKDLWIFAGMVIIAANAGGAFTPIGDVTTIMLWIKGYVTTQSIIVKLAIPSLLCLFVPLAIVSFKAKGVLAETSLEDTVGHDYTVSETEKWTVFIIGVGSLLFVPIFKMLTHLPPFIGILMGLSVLWIVTELFHFKKEDRHQRDKRSVGAVLKKVDTSSVLFFLGILLAVAALGAGGQLKDMSDVLNNAFSGNIYVINTLIGLLSAVVDNVPLVAGSMVMYDGIYPVDHHFWNLLAYCAGTGGSIFIIGSAAGVAVMGILKIDFMWYAKNIAFAALMGYIAGIAAYWIMFAM